MDKQTVWQVLGGIIVAALIQVILNGVPLIIAYVILVAGLIAMFWPQVKKWKHQKTKSNVEDTKPLASVPEDFFDEHITWEQLGSPEKPNTVDVVNLGQVKVDKRDINEANKAKGNLKFKLIDTSSKDFKQPQYLLGSAILTNKPLQSRQPKRITLTELRDHAIERGWRFNQESYEPLDFLDAIRQSAVDETLTVYGREKKTVFDAITRTEPLIPIPKKYWHDHQIEISSVLRAIDNYIIETVSRSPLDRDKGIVYADLQMDRNEALKWFHEDAPQHKGKREKAYGENA